MSHFLAPSSLDRPSSKARRVGQGPASFARRAFIRYMITFGGLNPAATWHKETDPALPFQHRQHHL